jgi:hypothetical protein
MKIRLRELRRLIREAMVSDLADDMYVDIEVEGGRAVQIAVRQAGKSKAHSPGVIRLERKSVPEGNVWEVVHSAAASGYGPMLYDLAMEFVVGHLGDLGITPDASVVSAEARRVWSYYLLSRPDVEKKELPREVFTGVGDRPEALRYYYYKVDSPMLDGYIARGLVRSDSFDF